MTNILENLKLLQPLVIIKQEHLLIIENVILTAGICWQSGWRASILRILKHFLEIFLKFIFKWY